MRIILETPRLLLREFNESDAGLMLDLNSDPEVVRYVGEPVLTSETEALTILRERIFPQYELHNMGRWAVIQKENDEFIGWCGLKYLPETGEIDLGYRFFKKHWGRGYGTESAKAVLEFGHRELKIPVITGKAALGNTASIHILERIGMKFKAEQDDHCDRVKVFTSERSLR